MLKTMAMTSVMMSWKEKLTVPMKKARKTKFSKKILNQTINRRNSLKTYSLESSLKKIMVENNENKSKIQNKSKNNKKSTHKKISHHKRDSPSKAKGRKSGNSK